MIMINVERWKQQVKALKDNGTLKCTDTQMNLCAIDLFNYLKEYWYALRIT